MNTRRTAAAIATIALTLGTLALVSGQAIAQTSTAPPSPAATAATAGCAPTGMGAGTMMGSDSSTGPGTMDHGAGMGSGMMESGDGMGHGMRGATPPPADGRPLSPTPSGEPAGLRLDVTLTDAFRIEPCTMTVRAGVPVTFVVTNSGAIAHEFFLGDEAAQAAHAQEMQSMGGTPMHDEPAGIALAPGETKELTYTFGTPGQYLAGCHVPGHYPAGMRAVITVTS